MLHILLYWFGKQDELNTYCLISLIVLITVYVSFSSLLVVDCYQNNTNETDPAQSTIGVINPLFGTIKVSYSTLHHHQT